MSKRYNEVRKEEFLAYYNAGLNDYDISRRMHISDSTIFRWRRDLGLPVTGSRVLSRNSFTEITEDEKEILCGTLLGDSSLQYYPEFRHRAPFFKCDHGPRQEEYAKLLCSQLQSLGATLRKYTRTDKRNGKEYISFCVKTKANPAFFSFYNELYFNGKKHITKSFLSDFTIKSLAYLYMDDGYADQKTAYICTDNFDSQSKNTLVSYIENKFNLHFKVVNHGKYYRLRLLQCDFERFKNLISPYIIDCLKYKLDTVS